MDADQSSSLQVPLLLSDLPRVPPITITKNESQGYVISRGHHHLKMAPGTEPTASSSYVVDYDTFVPQLCEYPTLAESTVVRPTTSSDSYLNTSQLTNVNLKNQSAVLQERISFQTNGSPMTPVSMHSTSVMSIPSGCQHYSPSYSTSASSHSAVSASNSRLNDSLFQLDGNDVANFFSGNVQNMSNYRPTTSSSLTLSTSATANTTPFSSSMSVDSSSYSFGQDSSTSCRRANLSPKSACTDPTFSSGALISSSSRSAKDAVVGSCGSSIQFVDLTSFSNDVRNGQSHSSSYAPSSSEGSSCNSVAASSTSNVGYIDSSSREVFKVRKGPRSSYTDSQCKIKTVLSEITFLMRSVRVHMNECAEKQSETPPQAEGAESKDCIGQLQRFIAYSNMNTPRSQLLPQSKKLFTMCQKQCQKYFVMMIRKEGLSQADEAMVQTMKLFLINLNKLYTVPGENANGSSSSAVRHESVISSTATACKYSSTDLGDAQDFRSCRASFASFAKDPQIERYETLLKYKETKISFLKTALAEKKGVEEKLEETKQKCAELEEKLKKKDAIGCWREDNISEWCCELMSELKTTMLNLLENEFKCCICDELLIQPGVTNCQHVFCTFCLNTWREKKKECPVCRAVITHVYKVNAIDEYITAATSSLSDKAYAERLQVIEDRKNTNPPPAKKPNWSGLQSAAPPPAINQPRPMVSQRNRSIVMPFTFNERNLPWLSDRLPFTNMVPRQFPSSADIPTSGPWSQQNIPLNTAGVLGRARRSTLIGSIDAVALDPPERRSSLDSYQ